MPPIAGASQFSYKSAAKRRDKFDRVFLNRVSMVFLTVLHGCLTEVYRGYSWGKFRAFLAPLLPCELNTVHLSRFKMTQHRVCHFTTLLEAKDNLAKSVL